MHNNGNELLVAGRKIIVFCPAQYTKTKKYSTLYLHSDEKNITMLDSKFDFSDFSFITIFILSQNRLADYSPWKAPALDSRFRDFGGEADLYLQWFINELQPCIEKNYSVDVRKKATGIVGYSLGGLCSLYWFCETDLFGFVGAISPSLWYKDFTEYLENHSQDLSGELMIVSGIDEGKEKNNAIRDVGKRLEQTIDILGELSGIKFTIELDEYGHHQNLESRYKKVFDYYIKKT